MERLIKNVAIVGGGAGGFFAALRCAEVIRNKRKNIKIQIFESSSNFLRKVKISGGGRCNVTNHIFTPKEFSKNYPRGQKELLSSFYQFQASDTKEWFSKRGVALKYEKDGRMFPTTDRSETIINCFYKEAEKYKIKLLNNKNISKLIKKDSGAFELRTTKGEVFKADRVLLATGSKPSSYELAKGLGHSFTELAPSLFTFKIKDLVLEGLQGTSFLKSKLVLKIQKGEVFKQEGPLLITHWGLSGPALLKLSAWAARELKKSNYKASLIVNWLGYKKREQVEDLFEKMREESPRSTVINSYPRELTKRFWAQLLKKSKVLAEKRWNEVSKKELNRIVQNLYECELEVAGKSRFKEEFVECGGVDLKEINFKTMESKICSGLYFSGELMDVDGVTGGFNFQHAWTSGWIAGGEMGENI